MKKLIVLAIAICAVQITTAQGPRNGNKAMQNLSAEEMATLQTKKMTLALDLTASQQDEIYQINLENAKMRKARMEERKAKRESGENMKPSEKERVEMANKMLDHKIAMKAKMKKILNEEQYNKWETSMANRGDKAKGKDKSKRKGKKG